MMPLGKPPGIPWLEGHSALLDDAGVYIFGGKMDSIFSNAVYYFDLAAGIWHRKVCRGKPPLPRVYHSTVLHNNRMIVFGGVLEHIAERNSLGEVQEPPFTQALCDLDLAAPGGIPTWDYPHSFGDVPPFLSNHSAVVYGSHMYVVGGFAALAGEAMSPVGHASAEFGDLKDCTVYRLCLDTFRWDIVLPSNQSSPPVIWGHSCVRYRDLLVSYGGIDAVHRRDHLYLDIWHLDRQEWRVVSLETVASPLGRACHTAVIDPQRPSKMLVFGGFSYSREQQLSELWVLDLDTGHWHEQPTSGEAPEPTHGHTAVVFDSQLIVYGGNGTGDSLHILDLENFRWRREYLKYQAPESIPDAYHDFAFDTRESRLVTLAESVLDSLPQKRRQDSGLAGPRPLALDDSSLVPRFTNPADLRRIERYRSRNQAISPDRAQTQIKSRRQGSPQPQQPRYETRSTEWHRQSTTEYSRRNSVESTRASSGAVRRSSSAMRQDSRKKSPVRYDPQPTDTRQSSEESFDAERRHYSPAVRIRAPVDAWDHVRSPGTRVRETHLTRSHKHFHGPPLRDSGDDSVDINDNMFVVYTSLKNPLVDYDGDERRVEGGFDPRRLAKRSALRPESPRDSGWAQQQTRYRHYAGGAPINCDELEQRLMRQRQQLHELHRELAGRLLRSQGQLPDLTDGASDSSSLDTSQLPAVVSPRSGRTSVTSPHSSAFSSVAPPYRMLG
eukprot:TRINITY_DN95582_c0_g1_i1.p1 TRINITY_DN95582_c0_g1~~TRINITY_DN95582_c0_g1_i1.p1  ORF type:complete len:735 (+),score=70.58 TRINITY_DN95582_c0_g1_i1:38-2206(+)